MSTSQPDTPRVSSFFCGHASLNGEHLRYPALPPQPQRLLSVATNLDVDFGLGDFPGGKLDLNGFLQAWQKQTVVFLHNTGTHIESGTPRAEDMLNMMFTGLVNEALPARRLLLDRYLDQFREPGDKVLPQS